MLQIAEMALLMRIAAVQIVPDEAEWVAVESNGVTEIHYKDLQMSFVYAVQRGLLSLIELHSDMEDRRSAEQQYVQTTAVPFETLYVPSSSACFDLKWVGDNPLWKLFLQRVLGYETILMNQLAKRYGATGFFCREPCNVISDMSYGIFNPENAAKSVGLVSPHRVSKNSAWCSLVTPYAVLCLQWLLYVVLKFKVLHTTLFLFFITTALVAFVLMETQKRMVTFTGESVLSLLI